MREFSLNDAEIMLKLEAYFLSLCPLCSTVDVDTYYIHCYIVVVDMHHHVIMTYNNTAPPHSSHSHLYIR